MRLFSVARKTGKILETSCSKPLVDGIFHWSLLYFVFLLHRGYAKEWQATNQLQELEEEVGFDHLLTVVKARLGTVPARVHCCTVQDFTSKYNMHTTYSTIESYASLPILHGICFFNCMRRSQSWIEGVHRAQIDNRLRTRERLGTKRGTTHHGRATAPSCY